MLDVALATEYDHTRADRRADTHLHWLWNRKRA